MQHTAKIISGPAVVLLALLVYISACKREPVYIGSPSTPPEDTSGYGIPCNPDSVYFNQQILPILTSNCAMPGCHDQQSHKEGVILDNYTNIRNTGKINLTSPANSKLYRVLNDSDPEDRMPPAPAAPLPLDQRALILKWIQQGALNLSCDPGCDTNNVTFSTGIMPLISLRCQGCHSGTNPSGGVSLTNYSQVKATVTSGTLVGSVNHKAGYKPMPYPAGSAKLPYCDIRKIQLWIDKGAPND